jgi:hypothetical protein
MRKKAEKKRKISGIGTEKVGRDIKVENFKVDKVLGH